MSTAFLVFLLMMIFIIVGLLTLVETQREGSNCLLVVATAGQGTKAPSPLNPRNCEAQQLAHHHLASSPHPAGPPSSQRRPPESHPARRR